MNRDLAVGAAAGALSTVGTITLGILGAALVQLQRERRERRQRGMQPPPPDVVRGWKPDHVVQGHSGPARVVPMHRDRGE